MIIVKGTNPNSEGQAIIFGLSPEDVEELKKGHGLVLKPEKHPGLIPGDSTEIVILLGTIEHFDKMFNPSKPEGSELTLKPDANVEVM